MDYLTICTRILSTVERVDYIGALLADLATIGGEL